MWFGSAPRPRPPSVMESPWKRMRAPFRKAAGVSSGSAAGSEAGGGSRSTAGAMGPTGRPPGGRRGPARPPPPGGGRGGKAGAGGGGGARRPAGGRPRLQPAPPVSPRLGALGSTPSILLLPIFGDTLGSTLYSDVRRGYAPRT